MAAGASTVLSEARLPRQIDSPFISSVSLSAGTGGAATSLSVQLAGILQEAEGHLGCQAPCVTLAGTEPVKINTCFQQPYS